MNLKLYFETLKETPDRDKLNCTATFLPAMCPYVTVEPTDNRF